MRSGIRPGGARNQRGNHMKTSALRHRLLASTLLIGAATFGAPALAQVDPGAGATPQAPVVGGSSEAATTDQSNQTDANGTVAKAGGEEIVVTGSRIPSPNLTSVSPLTVIGSQEVKLQGTMRTEDLLNSLPQVFADQGSSLSNGATGTASVNLRNLGAVRTLVLVNGRRLVPGDPTFPVADLNFIPASLIQRVDVLTGGASSVYGADAVAGVVNFIMNKSFEGVQLDAQYSLYSHDNRAGPNLTDPLNARAFPYIRGNSFDGAARNVTLTLGTGLGDNRGHITAYASWRKVDPVLQADRDYSTCGYSTSSALGLAPGTFQCGGSSTGVPGRFRRTTNVALGAVPVYAPTGPSLTLNPAAPNGNGFRPYVGTRDAFNFNPFNYFQRPDERYSFGAFADYEISDAVKPYLEVMFMDDRSLAQIAPSGAFYGTDFFINCNNPFLSAGQATSLCGEQAGTSAVQSVYLGRRNVEGGARVDDLRHTSYRIVAGAKGVIAKGFNYDVYGQFGRAILNERYQNDFSRNRLNRALNVVNGPNGQPVCASAIPNATGQVIDANCVPYNIFSIGGVSQASINYLQTPGLRTGQTTEYVASASISGALGEYGLQSPLADEGIGIAVGTEFRKETLQLRNDIEFLTGDLAGQGTPFGVADATGSFSVYEAFGELQVPLINNRPFFESLSFNGSYRFSHYNTIGNTDTYRLGAEYAPVRGIRFRGSYNRAVRAPNIVELFTPATVQLFNSNGDPCAGEIDGGLVNGNTLAQCARTGVTAANFGTIDASPAFQYNQRTAGSASLRAETADSYTAGFVVTPSFLRGFSLTVDGFDIRVRNTIGTVGAEFSLNQCLQSGNPFFCNNINRAAGSGSLFTGNSFVDNPTQNLGKFRTRGIDVGASYRLQLSNLGLTRFGSLGFDFVGTYLDKFEVTPISGPQNVGTYDCSGLFGSTCGTPSPKWRHKLRLTLNTPANIQFSGAWRYFGKVKNDQESTNTLLGSGPGTADPVEARIKAVNYFDLAMSARVGDHYSFRIGAQNILDRTPPIVSSGIASNGNTYSQVYDALGRYLFAGATIEF